MSQTEAQFERAVLDLAKLHRWRVYHTRNSRGSVEGFPDLTLARGRELMFVELKTERGRVSRAQQEWLDALGATTGTRAYVWRPADWPAIEDILWRGPSAHYSNF